MGIHDIPFGITDWSAIEPSEHAGETATACWRTRQFGPIRVRRVETRRATWRTTGAARATSCCAGKANCTPNWPPLHADPGMSYQVADGAGPHRSSSETGATLFVVD